MKNKNWWFRFQFIVVTAIFALFFGAGSSARADDTPSNVAVVKMSSLTNSMVQLDTPIAEAYTLDGQKSDIPFWGQNGLAIPDYACQYAINLDTGTLYYSCSSTDPHLQVSLWFPANDQTILIPESLAVTDPNKVQTRTFTFSFLDQNDKPLTTSESTKASYSPNANYSGDPFTGLADSLKATDTTTHKLIASRAFPGYKLRDQDPVTNTDSDYNFTYHYVKDTPTSKPSTGTSVGSSTTTEADSASNSSSSVTPVHSTKVPVQRKAVYAVKKIGLYSQPTFTKQSRTRWFTKQTRPNRPTFTVIGYARSKAGNLRYKVRTADGTTGYITTRSAYVTNAYYQVKPATVKVISAKGLNAYGNVALNGKKIRHYARGSVLKVKSLKTHGLTTRLVLTNGHYVTGKKTFVIQK